MGHRPPHRRLPVELLVKIFKSAATPLPYWAKNTTNPRYYQRLHLLAQVCRLWAEVVKGSPELWWLVNGRDPSSEWTTALHRSRDSLIVFKYGLYGDGAAFDHHLWSSVSQHLHRWKTADLAFNFAEAGLSHSFTLLENAAPALETMRMRSSRPFTEQITLDLFNGYAPKLTTLDITNVAFRDWSSPVLQGLTSLWLGFVSYSGPSLEQMLDVLRASPRLDWLSLNNIRFSSDAAVGKPSAVLLELRSINLSSLSSVVTSRLLRAIDAPKCTTTQVQVADEERPDNELYDVTTAWATPAIKKSLAVGGEVDINICTPRFVSFSVNQIVDHRSDYDSTTVLYLPDIPTRPSILEWGLALMESSDSSHASLTVRIEIEAMRPQHVEEILAILRRLPNIVALEMMGDDHDAVTSILRNLTFAGPISADGPSPWLCPDLRDLSIDAGVEEEVLMDMVRSRTRAAALRETEGSGSGVGRLQELTVYGEDTMDARIFRNIRSIVGRKTSCRWVSEAGIEMDCPEEDEEEDEDSGCRQTGSNDGDDGDGRIDNTEADEPAVSSTRNSLASGS